MERMTIRDAKGRACIEKQREGDESYLFIQNNYYIRGDAADRLAAYEDAEEQGLLVRLPCKMAEYGKWINVNDSLPELGKVVLVHGAGGGIYTAKLTEIGWWKLNSRFHECNPMYWMPLPDAPKEEKA